MEDVPCSPVATSPARPLGSVRRTSHIDMTFPGDGGEVMLVLAGGARDLLTTADGGRVMASGVVEAEIGFDRRVMAVRTEPRRRETDALVGVPAGSGFRRQIDAVLPDERGTTLGLLLDDIPVATLISGYATLRSAAAAGGAAVRTPDAAAMARSVLARMSDTCSGWRSGGTAVRQIADGSGMQMQDCPPAPTLGVTDPLAWHDQPRLSIGAMRRRRRIDVRSGPGGWVVDAMFRDTYGETAGFESVLHEYSLTAMVSGDDLRVTDVEVVPRVLPFAECPWAAQNVRRLVGHPVASLRREVPVLLASVDGCTHLNDLLRALADVPALIALGA